MAAPYDLRHSLRRRSRVTVTGIEANISRVAVRFAVIVGAVIVLRLSVSRAVTYPCPSGMVGLVHNRSFGLGGVIFTSAAPAKHAIQTAQFSDLGYRPANAA